jgi:thioredoxin-like negative regulator of GroEL
VAGCDSANRPQLANLGTDDPLSSTSAIEPSAAAGEPSVIVAEPEVTATVPQGIPQEEPPAADPWAFTTAVPGGDKYDELNRGKRQFREKNYGLAERHFRRAVEAQPRDAESWIGLAASYDRLRRFDLADRAYRQAIAILGPRPEILNNQGFSYILRGDYRRARAKLMAAHQQDPKNPYINNNLALLERSVRTGKGIQ